MAPSGLGVRGGRLRRRRCLLREQRRALATTDEHHEDQHHADDQQPGDDVLVSADVAQDEQRCFAEEPADERE